MSAPSSEVFSHRVSTRRRTYYFDVKRLHDGSRFLSIREVTQRASSTKARSRIIIAEEELAEFAEGLRSALEFCGLRQRRAQKSVEEIRRNYPNAYAKWTPEDNDSLRRAFSRGITIPDLAEQLQRQPSAIRSHLRKLGLLK